MNDSINEATLYAQKYLEDLLSFFGLNINVDSTIDDEVIQLSIPSSRMNGFLIGQNGDNMRSFQYLVMMALKNKEYEHFRVSLDIADYKKHRADRLKEVAEGWVKEVQETKKPMDLEPMNPADRRIVHQLAADYGLLSESVGFGRDRHIVLQPLVEEAASLKKEAAKQETKETVAVEKETAKEIKDKPAKKNY